jgi:hypothetical protein
LEVAGRVYGGIWCLSVNSNPRPFVERRRSRDHKTGIWKGHDRSSVNIGSRIVAGAVGTREYVGGKARYRDSAVQGTCLWICRKGVKRPVYCGGVYRNRGAVAVVGVSHHDSGLRTLSALWMKRVNIIVRTNDWFRNGRVPIVVTHCPLTDDDPTARWWSCDASCLTRVDRGCHSFVHAHLSRLKMSDNVIRRQ